jgi:hypothetical protein
MVLVVGKNNLLMVGNFSVSSCSNRTKTLFDNNPWYTVSFHFIFSICSLLFLHRINRNHQNRKEDTKAVKKLQSPSKTSLRGPFSHKRRRLDS